MSISKYIIFQILNQGMLIVFDNRKMNKCKLFSENINQNNKLCNHNIKTKWLTYANLPIFDSDLFFFLNYSRSYDFFGIYVVMFLEILRTLLQVLFIFSILIIAFGLSFYMLMFKEVRINISDFCLVQTLLKHMLNHEIRFSGYYHFRNNRY